MSGMLPDSIYVWACGEKSSRQAEDLITSDELIGCLILLVRLTMVQQIQAAVVS